MRRQPNAGAENRAFRTVGRDPGSSESCPAVTLQARFTWSSRARSRLPLHTCLPHSARRRVARTTQPSQYLRWVAARARAVRPAPVLGEVVGSGRPLSNPISEGTKTG